ncbi:TPA: hypothetical protein DCR79_00370 [Patescibacteria group bacterium]|uniref:ASCH domain protein n=1 Tax=candidate division Kazan bacterium GW2011_GWB1_45_10 TaxID=1620411 RepID=A0A0G1NRI0_UNCK3|nr:MAG: ASCH domain protein [candidate division Kazan bacterium GW2011_GWB1_45_10]HAR54737.1 hypothetical protein [Patescibacteria group bacterium]HCR41836.1 hypothetical protein [Patescibacteria group bacterium]
MAIVKKKMWPGYLEDITSGKKKYDMRLNDFEINEGDTLVLEEWDPATQQYTGRNIEKKVAYVGKFDLKNSFWPTEEILDKGIQIISLE